MVYPNEQSRLTKSTGVTSYTEVALLLDGDPCLVAIPPVLSGQVLLVAHGHSGDETTINNVRMVEIRNRMLERGWIVASSYAKGNSWGNDAGQAAYVLLWAWIVTNLGTTGTLLFGQSMGACILALVKAGGAITDALGLVTIDGALNLAVAHASASYRSAIRTAYGIASDGSDYSTKTAGHDPCLISPAGFTGARLLVEASTGDTAIPKTTHSDVFVAHITGYPAQLSRLTGTGVHVAVENYFPEAVEAFAMSTLEPLPAGDVFLKRQTLTRGGNPVRAYRRYGIGWREVHFYVRR